ncbi:MAG: polysaccharide deacetylase family protein [Thermoleophilia bacterium]|nr:polysaccharide deacetylase family protein [Thermoleophilia bacterium]
MRRRLARAIRKRARGAVVLLYHRVGDGDTDAQLLSVAPERFAEHLELIVGEEEILSLADLALAVRSGGDLPGRGVAVTFDDGYADNLIAAKPLLERRGVPATVFVTAGLLGGRFWWDELERLLLRPGRLPRLVSLEIGDEELRVDLGEDADYGAGRAARVTRWTVLDRNDPGPRQRLYRLLADRLRPLEHDERERVIDRLRAVTAPDEPNGAAARRPLTLAELQRLAAHGLIDVGAHTVTHPVLAALPQARQREEIEGSKARLEEAFGRPVRAFSYPYGTIASFDDSTVRLVRGAGFTHACANVQDRVGGGTDLYRIPRLLVRDWSGDELARRLSQLRA